MPPTTARGSGPVIRPPPTFSVKDRKGERPAGHLKARCLLQVAAVPDLAAWSPPPENQAPQLALCRAYARRKFCDIHAASCDGEAPYDT